MRWRTKEELKSLIEKEEDAYIEKTESFAPGSGKDKIAKTICAFSNNLSGEDQPAVIFIGVKDDGKYASLSVTDQMLLNLSSIRGEGNIQPFPIITVDKIVVSDKQIAVVQVQPSFNPPVRYKSVCYVRVGPSVRTATGEEEKLLVERRVTQQLSYDMEGVADAKLESDLDMEFFKMIYLKKAVSTEVLESNNRDEKIQMQSLRLLDRKMNPTRTALLIMGIEPRNWFPGAFIQFIRFKGKELTDTIENQKEVSGTLPDQISRIEEILQLNISMGLKLTDTVHNKSQDYPMDTLRQLIRNAVIHRNYESFTPIKVHWFADRIEIQSPGGPCGEITVNNFGEEGLTSYRNPTLVEALKNLGFVERFGVGIPIAKKALKENGNPKLEFKVENSVVMAVIKKVL